MSEFEKSKKMEKEKIGKETVLVSPFGCRTGKNTYLRMLVFALFMLAAVGFLSSCATSGKSDAPEEEMTTTPPEPTMPTEPDPTPGEVAAAAALAAYDTAKDTNDNAIAAYQAGPTQMTAGAAKDAADALKVAADAASEVAVNGNDAQKLAAASAVLYANNAVTTAAGAVADAKKAADEVAEQAANEEAARLALEAYDTAKTAYDAAKTAYDADGGKTLANAQALHAAAEELEAKADAAMTAAAEGTADQQTAADAAVTAADDAVEHAAIVLTAIQEGISEYEAANLQRIQTEAADAATAAGEASTDAGTAADDAEDAIVNRAMFQTGEADSDDHADMARMYAGGPDDDADDDVVSAAEAAAAAAAALTAANGATNANDARDAAGDAEDAQEDAETAQGKAEEQRDMAVEDAMEEVFVEGKVIRVGDRWVDFNFNSGKPLTVISDDEMIIIGMQREIMDTSERVADIDPVTAIPTATPPVVGVTAKPAIAARDIVIGAEFDSRDDDARVTLIDSYIDKRSVNAYTDTNAAEFTVVGASYDYDAGQTYDHDNSATTAEISVPPATIRAVNGRFIESDTAVDETGTILANADANGIRLYYYTNINRNSDPDDDVQVYLREVNYITTPDTVTHTYQEVDVVRGVVDFPVAEEYDHFNFGVWSNLEKAEDDGTNDLDDLGIGFLTVLDGGEMTPVDDMPTRGDAKFVGNWVANVQAANPSGHGHIMTQTGKVEMDADFGGNDVEIKLMNLAVLDGKIDRNEFFGTDASYHNVATNVSGLASDGDFMGSFVGGFFGDDAENAGGVFMFTSDDDNEDGAFAGSFGTVQSDEGPVD